MKRLMTGVLVAALLLSQTSIADVFVKADAATVTAAEQDAESVIETEETVEVYNAEGRTISAFIELPDEIKVQSVPVGTALDELKLPDTLEAVRGDTVADTDMDAGTGTDTNADTDADADTDTNAGADEDVYVDVSNVADTNADTYIDTDVAPDDDTLGGGTADAEGDTEKAETFSVTMPEYRTENVIEVKTLEAGTLIIENVTWQSEPEYDGDTEGEYIFTAVLPDEYVLTDGVNTPQITVTVGETDNIVLMSGDGIMLMAADFGGGDGSSAESAYEISTAGQLAQLATDVNNGTNYEGKYFKLTKGFDLSDLSGEWTPIGSNVRPFKGNFDGGGHTISGVSINLSDASAIYAGLFGYVSGSTIQNLTVNGTVDITASSRGNVGGIVGRNEGGTITNCLNQGEINIDGRGYVGGIVGFNSEGTITNCRNESAINIGAETNGSIYAGGIVGQDFEGTVTNCRNQGTVTDTENDAYVGGIVGGNNAAATIIKNCWNEGDVTGNSAGGIMGIASSSTPTTIENCWNEGDVTGETNNGNAGGIVGYNQENENITNCGNQGRVAGDSAGGIVGYNNTSSGNITITNCYYLDTTANEAVGRGTVEGTAEAKTSTELASGEVAWLLQNGQASQNKLVWGQLLTGDSKDDFPRLACFMDGDNTAKETKRVLKVAFYNAESSTASYTEYGDAQYVNKNDTVELPDEPQRPIEFPSGKYKAVWLDSTDNTAKIFGVDTPVEKDTDLYLFYKHKEAFAGEDGTINTQHGTSKTEDLDDYIKYVDNTSATGNFTYAITAGNGELGASLNGSTLTIPGTAGIGSYELTIKASETTSQMENLKDEVNVTVDVTDSNIDSVTFKLTVIVEKSDSDLIDEAKDVVQKVLDDMKVTNETTKKDVQDAIDKALEEAGLENVTVTVGDDFTVEEATEESEGKITGTVTLEIGGEKGEVEIDKTIDQLGQSGMPQEPTPKATLDRQNGKITGLTPGAKYDITYTDKDGTQHTDTVTADENGNLEIEDNWTGGDIEIVKKGDDTDTSDSQPQKLEIPKREPAPSDVGMSKKADKDGKGGSIGGLTPGETYQISKDGGKTWEDVTADEDGEIKPIDAGSYDIRKKAGDDTMPSKPVHVQVTKEKGSSSGGGSGSGGSGSGNDGSDNGDSTGGNDGGSSSDNGSSGGGDDSGNDNGGQTPGGGNGGTGPGTGTGTPGGTQPGSGDKAGTGGTGGTGNKGGTGNTGSTGNTDKDKEDRTTGGSGDGSTDSGDPGNTDNPADGDLGSSSSGGADAETSDGSGHTVQAELENGEIVISGDDSGTDGTADSGATGAAIATGTIGTAQSTTTILTVGEGAVTVTVDSDGYRGVAGVTDTVAVANAVLTPEQKQRVNDGGKISVRVEVKDISGQVSQQDKDIIESGLVDNKITDDIDGQEQGELTLGAYIDISMYIRVDDGDWDAVTQSDEPIEVVIGIPDELQSEGRTYYIARSHEGAFALLDDLDSEADTITIRTELFSTYAIVFRQMLGTGGDADASSGFPASLSWTAVALWSLGILVMLGIAIFLIFWKRSKEEDAAG